MSASKMRGACRTFFVSLIFPIVLSLVFPPVSFASPNTYLKAPSARDGGVHQELAWILGADVSPAQASQLAAGAKELVSTAFDERRTFMVGADDKEIAKQIDAFARAYHARTGRRFSVAGTEVFTNFIPDAQKIIEGKDLKEIQGAIQGLAKAWRERTGKGFGRDKRNEDGTPDFHEVNIKDALAERIARASSFIRETLASGEGTVYATTAKRLSEETRIVLILDEEGIPALLSNGVEGTPEHQALVSYAGRHRYAGWKGGDTTTPSRPRSIYLSLVQVEELMKRADKETLGSLLYHHDRDLQNGKHEDPSPAAAEKVNRVLQEIFTAYREKYLAKVEAEHKIKLQRVTTTVVSLDIATWLGGATRIPDEVVAFAENELKNEMAAETITAFVVKARGKDLDIQVNHQKGQESPIIQKILTDLMVRILVKAVSPPSETWEEVRKTAGSYVSYRPAEMTYTERGAEPILIAKAIDAGPGFFNKALWNLFSHPDLQSTTTIDAFAAPGYRYVLSSVQDLLAGKKNPRTLVFETPKDRDLLQSFASNPDAWVITEVYTTVDTLETRGRFRNRPLVSLVGSLPLIIGLVFPPSAYPSIPAQLRAPMNSRDGGVAQAIARDLQLLSGSQAVQDGGSEGAESTAQSLVKAFADKWGMSEAISTLEVAGPLAAVEKIKEIVARRVQEDLPREVKEARDKAFSGHYEESAEETVEARFHYMQYALAELEVKVEALVSPLGSRDISPLQTNLFLLQDKNEHVRAYAVRELRGIGEGRSISDQIISLRNQLRLYQTSRVEAGRKHNKLKIIWLDRKIRKVQSQLSGLRVRRIFTLRDQLARMISMRLLAEESGTSLEVDGIGSDMQRESDAIRRELAQLEAEEGFSAGDGGTRWGKNYVVYEGAGPLGTIQFTRTQQLNAANDELLTGIDQALTVAEGDPDVRVIALTGSGKAFMAGADISVFEGITSGRMRALIEKGQALTNRIESSPKKVVAGINGYALGGGLEIALSAHYRIAVKDAKVGLPEITLGLIPGWGGTQRATRLAGPGIAIPLILNGTYLTAGEALEIGLVDEVVEDEAAMVERLKELAEDPSQIPARRDWERIAASRLTTLMATLMRPDIQELRIGQMPDSVQYPRGAEEEAWDRIRAAQDVLSAVWEGYRSGMQVGLEEEAVRVSRLVETESGQRRIQAFLNKEKPSKIVLVPMSSRDGGAESETVDPETLGKMVMRAVPDAAAPLSSDVLRSTLQGTIVVYEESLDNFTIATMVERFGRQLNSVQSPIGFVLVSTSGKSESAIITSIYRDSKGLVNLNGVFRATLVEGEVNTSDPLSVTAALEERKLPPLVELVAPLEIVVAYRRPGIDLYGWLVSRNPQEGEEGVANGAPAIRELVELLGLGEKERVSLLRDGGRSFMVAIQRFQEEFEAFDFSYREGRRSD